MLSHPYSKRLMNLYVPSSLTCLLVKKTRKQIQAFASVPCDLLCLIPACASSFYYSWIP